jgi:hypothetical protein
VTIGKDATATDSVELRVVNGWTDWTGVVPPKVTISSARLNVLAPDLARVTGRVSVADDGVFNVIVFAVLEGANGGWGVISDAVECVRGGSPAPFELITGSRLPSKPRIETVVGYTTTIPGIGVDRPPVC